MSSLFVYPGGKGLLRSQITLALARACEDYRLPYREPFVGGGVMALHMLEFDRADKFWINDKDAGLACFWKSVIEQPDALVERIDAFEPSVEEFHDAKRILLNHQGGVPTDLIQMVELGFCKLVVQKLSHSGLGVMSGSPRGGNAQDGAPCLDNGRWRVNRIDSRWSPPHMCREVTNYSFLFNRVETVCTNLDFSAVILDESEQSSLFLDPPYWEEGQDCYLHSFTEQDHVRLADLLRKTRHAWVLTYGDCPEIRELYGWAAIEEVNVKSCIANRTKAELLIYRETSHEKKVKAA